MIKIHQQKHNKMEYTEEEKQAVYDKFKAQYKQDQETLAVYLLANGIILECMDRLSSKSTPFKWIEHETKAAYNHFEKTFTKKHKKHLNALFNLKGDTQTEGEVLVDTQEQIIEFLGIIGRLLGSFPVHTYPQVIEKLLTMDIVPQGLVEEVKKELDENTPS